MSLAPPSRIAAHLIYLAYFICSAQQRRAPKPQATSQPGTLWSDEKILEAVAAVSMGLKLLPRFWPNHAHVAVLITFDDDTTGKLGFYLAAVNRTMRTLIEGPSIGVLLCESRSGPMVEFALENTNPIGVSTYQVTRELPAPMFTAASLKGRLDMTRSSLLS